MVFGGSGGRGNRMEHQYGKGERQRQAKTVGASIEEQSACGQWWEVVVVDPPLPPLAAIKIAMTPAAPAVIHPIVPEETPFLTSFPASSPSLAAPAG